LNLAARQQNPWKIEIWPLFASAAAGATFLPIDRGLAQD
jgi:hypothetical protein